MNRSVFQSHVSLRPVRVAMSETIVITVAANPASTFDTGIAARADAVQEVAVMAVRLVQVLVVGSQRQLQQRCGLGLDPAADDVHPALVAFEADAVRLAAVVGEDHPHAVFGQRLDAPGDGRVGQTFGRETPRCLGCRSCSCGTPARPTTRCRCGARPRSRSSRCSSRRRSTSCSCTGCRCTAWRGRGRATSRNPSPAAPAPAGPPAARGRRARPP